MKLLLLYWSFLIVGYILAARLNRRGQNFLWASPAMMIAVYALCFVMGLRMGVNEEVTSNIGTIGLKALGITIVCIAGSMAAITMVRKLLKMDKYGNATGKGDHKSIGTESHEESRLDMKSTIIIVALVAAGMIIGALVIAKSFSMILDAFDYYSNLSLILILCFLLFLVGLDLGKAGNIFANFKSIGFKVVIFPVAAIVGTVIAGTVACIIMGFTMKEGCAISLGFGWYSYAPVVISNAGSQYMIAGAVSFMHNVMRETAGIIFIPILARKFGYIESTGVPGVAAMDVCMPIVEKSCRQETVLYSFATGLLMCIVTSIGVPLIMG